ncbi:MAG: right-handed parallel beta-helix repeat-containing protein [Planctomycetota bacterium]
MPLNLMLISMAGGVVQGELLKTKIWYANLHATGANDGTSWHDAFVDLHHAFALAQPGDEVWVAKGVYKPDRGTGDPLLFFPIPNGVALYGGFDGSEISLDQRDWVVNETIISGDLKGDDGPHDCEEVSDCCRVHEGPGCDDPTCAATVCAIRPECCIESPDPKNPNFRGWDEGCRQFAFAECCGLGSWQRCDNSILLLGGRDLSLPVTVDGLTIESTYFPRRGTAPGGAGGLALLDRATVIIRNCVFRQHQYGALGNEAGQIAVSNTLFLENIRYTAGLGDEVTIEDCTFLSNTGEAFTGGNVVIRRTVFMDTEFVPLYVSGNLTMSDCRFIHNGRRGGNVFAFSDGYALIRDCEFTDNFQGASVGWGSAVFENCKFLRQYSLGGIGALTVGGASVTLRNCLVAGNQAAQVLYAGDGRLTISNCTFTENRSIAVRLGSKIDARIRNSIFWGNGRDYGGGQQQQIWPFLVPEINNCIVQGWTGNLGGVGNSGVDPLLVDPLGQDRIAGTEDDDLRLQPASPAIDTGGFYSGMSSTDLDGYPRVLCGRPDIGAYEFGIGDFNCDRTVDLWDFAGWSYCATGPIVGPPAPMCEAFDFDANRKIDLFDFAQFETVAFPRPRPPLGHRPLDPE